MLKVGQWCVLAQENRAHAENLLSIAICSRAESTGNKYQAAFIRWRNFASSKAFVVLPANPGQFIMYLEEVMKSTGSKHSVEEACNAATWIHGIAGLQSPVEDGTVRAVMEGARRLLAKRVVKKEPVSVEHLQQIVANTDMSNLGDVRTATLCLLCFSAFLRYAEMADLRCSDVVITEEHMKLVIRKSKTDQYRQGNEVLVARTGNSTCPVKMMEVYLRLAEADLRSDEMLFRPIVATKRGARLRSSGKMSYTRTRELVLGALSDIGLDKSQFGVHSLRAGGATAAASAGIPDRAFKKHGRWKSERAKDGYVKDTESYRLSVTRDIGL